MIQDIAPWAFRIGFEPRAPEAGDLVLDFDSDGLLCAPQQDPHGEGSPCPDNGLPLPSCALWSEAAGEGKLLYAFRLDHEDARVAPLRFFLVLRDTRGNACTPEGWRRVPASGLRDGGGGHLAFAAITGLHLHRWYAGSRFCASCGSRTQPGGRERSLVCPACGATAYPSLPPSVLVAVRDGERLLLTRYDRPGATRYVLVAGYVEAGEVMEETGIRIRSLRYAGSQPWGLSGTLSLAFTAELDGPDLITMDTEELAEARWIHRQDIPPVPNEDSLTMKIIASFQRGEW